MYPNQEQAESFKRLKMHSPPPPQMNEESLSSPSKMLSTQAKGISEREKVSKVYDVEDPSQKLLKSETSSISNDPPL
jgi:hypothetical protein